MPAYHPSSWLPEVQAHRRPRRPGALVLLALAVAIAQLGCGAASSPADRAVTANVELRREYKNLRARWFATKTGERAALGVELRKFRAKDAGGELGRSAGLLLAWVHLENGELSQAQRLVDEARRPGEQPDFAIITEAAIATRSGKPERGLALLDPLSGKIVDPDERVLHGEERVRAALAARRFELSLGAMFDWLVQSPADRHDEVRKSVLGLLSRVPARDLLSVLAGLDEALASRPASTDASMVRGWLKKTIFAELTRRALDDGDAALARALLPHAPPAVRGTPEFAALARQAAAGSSGPRIAGRAVGLLLNLGSEAARRRSAAFATGVSRGLEGGAGRVELVVKDDAGSIERTTAALSGLASQGAAILIAGIDPESAVHAAAFAERARIPLLLTGELDHERKGEFVFSLGVSDDEVSSTLAVGLEQRGRRRPSRVGTGGVPCEIGSSFAGRARFPIEEWRKQGIDALVVMGDSACARDVVREVKAARLPVLVACGLECAGAAISPFGPALAVRAGSFPSAERTSYYEALGRDAALLARAALAEFPEQAAVDKAEVGALHELARRTLEQAEVELWTSEVRGFAGKRVLPRTLATVDGATQPDFKGNP